ncbi:hypothetical protein ABIB54_000493 [Frigoribacterium sp. UYMn621]
MVLDERLLKVDARGRVTIGNAVRRNAIEPSPYYTIAFGESGKLILTPVSFSPTSSHG